MMDTALLNSQPADAPAPPGADAARPAARLWPLIVLLVVGAALRLAVWHWSQGQEPHIVDELDYITLARNLVLCGEFVDGTGMRASLRPPLYPALMAGVYGLFGVDNFQAVRLAQAVLS